MHDVPLAPKHTPAGAGGGTATEIWDDEWLRAWKAHPANPWFTYEAGVYAEQLGPAPARRPQRGLKTDAFDEACGRAGLSAALGPDLVVADVSPRIVRQAVRALGDGVTACAADVRDLPFPPSTFDVVLSTSTLDHFDERREITIALAELERVLRADGRLFVTLDNPANPLLRVRQLVYGKTGAVAGLIPFRMGLTLSRRALVAAAEEAGLTVHESGYLIHAPRVLGLWVGEWAARRNANGVVRAVAWLLGALERTARRLPTRRWTAHFIYADCRPRSTPSGRGRRSAVVRMPRWLAAAKAMEHRVRYGYLRWCPPRLLGRIDPALRRAVTVARRTAAAPIYLRQALREHAGRCDGAPARIAVWSAPHAPALILDALLDDRAAVADGATYGLPAVARGSSALAPSCDVLVAHTTPALAGRFRANGFHIVPGMARLGGAPGALLAALDRPSMSLAGDLRRLRHARHRVECWSYTRERCRLFFYRYYLPHARTRHEERAEVAPWAMVERMFKAGMALVVSRPGRSEPDAIALVVPRGDTLACLILGTCDADPDVMRTGGIAALYVAQIRFAYERGLRVVDAGRCLPWESDGVYRYKLKWGFRPMVDPAQTLELAVKVLRPESAVARRLVERGVVVREGTTLRRFSADDLRTL